MKKKSTDSPCLDDTLEKLLEAGEGSLEVSELQQMDSWRALAEHDQRAIQLAFGIPDETKPCLAIEQDDLIQLFDTEGLPDSYVKEILQKLNPSELNAALSPKLWESPEAGATIPPFEELSLIVENELLEKLAKRILARPSISKKNLKEAENAYERSLKTKSYKQRHKYLKQFFSKLFPNKP